MPRIGILAVAMVLLSGGAAACAILAGLDQKYDGSAADASSDDVVDAPLDTPAEVSAPVDAGVDGPRPCARLHGSDAARITRGAITFCIDTTEVSAEQYAEFYAADAAIPDPQGPCKGKSAFSKGSPDAGFPVVFLDWCDALAFCAWAGKRLCTSAEWGSACSGFDAHAYSYGDIFDSNKCAWTGCDGTILPIASQPQCVGAADPRVHDLVGNAREWIADCEGNASPSDTCYLTSSICDSPADQKCTRREPSPPLTEGTWDMGVRCCSD
jgi:formylglycine-generating enzyme required for sulfatase activity